MAARVLWLLVLIPPRLYSTAKTCDDLACPTEQTCVLLHKALNRRPVPYCITRDDLTTALDTNTECRNGGYIMPCYSPGSDCHAPKQCVCHQEFTGVNCEYRYCSESFGGMCAYGICDVKLGCLCYPGYHGNRCEYRICSISGRCVHGNCEQGICKCNSGYTSASCDEIECNGLTCLNDGYCRLGSCVCMSGFFGLNCEMKICRKTHLPCYQGDCSRDGACTCYGGYTGEHCHHKVCSSTICSQFSICEPVQCGSNNFVPHFCHNGGDCFLFFEQCRCTDQFMGDYCETKKELCGGRQLCLTTEFCINGHCCSADKVADCKPDLQNVPISLLAVPEPSLPW
ncbi:adhesive plaque matrix protein 2-like [Watersipora subatra]|uniref:adhesive plaque matrix protein 2-like n=1 Tax=Watersipora subatra TaxID=2589382 RepID=UPI00355C893D